MSMPFKAVLFDLWETLINDTHERAQPRRVWRTGEVQTVLSRHGFEVETEPVQAALDACGYALNALHDEGKDLGRGGRARLFLDQLELAAAVRGPEAALDELEDVITSMPLDMAPRPANHAVEAVVGLKALGVATALVCNAGFTTAAHLRPLLAHYDLLAHLDVQVFSDELEIAKPDPRIFAAALEGLGLEAADCAFVGDNPHTDIWGALNAGLYTVQVGAKMRDGVTPHARIESLEELLPALGYPPVVSPSP
jgi:FMN phosphatase YigB (HAD superfamily)